MCFKIPSTTPLQKSEQYGESQSAYLVANNFNNSRRNHNTVSRLIATLQRAASTTDYVYINYYRNTYGNIPLWVLINVLTFGNLSKMYKVFPQSLQSKVCKNFGIINQRQMEQFLSVLTKFRNVCAHGERLFTYRTRIPCILIQLLYSYLCFLSVICKSCF